MTRKIWGSALLVLGVIFCPCHLVITLPLLGAWLGGSALTGFLSHNASLVITVSTVLFVGSVLAGWSLITHKPACELEPGAGIPIRKGTAPKGEAMHGTQKNA